MMSWDSSPIKLCYKSPSVTLKFMPCLSRIANQQTHTCNQYWYNRVVRMFVSFTLLSTILNAFQLFRFMLPFCRCWTIHFVHFIIYLHHLLHFGFFFHTLVYSRSTESINTIEQFDLMNIFWVSFDPATRLICVKVDFCVKDRFYNVVDC